MSSAPRSPPRPRSRRLLVALAAVLVVGSAAWWIGGAVLARTREDEAGRPGGAEPTVLAVATDLAARRPDLFGDFVPVSAAERASARRRTPEPVVLREPAGATGEERPVFRWDETRGTTDARVTLRREDGAEVWTRAAAGASTLPYPADAPALERGVAYAWEVSAASPLGPVVGWRGFRVATAEEVARVEEALRILRAAPRGRLAAAHYLARRDWLARAEGEARAHLEARPGDEEALDLLRYLAARRGLPAEGPAAGSD